MKKLLWIVACCVLGAVTLSAEKPASAAPPTRPAAVASAAPNSVASNLPASEAGVVNLNEASPEQLSLLPGVGPSRANAIVSHRKLHPFKRLEELMRVKGFGKKTYNRLRPLLSLAGPTTLKDRPSLAKSPRRT
jgi:competence protein ComEA